MSRVRCISDHRARYGVKRPCEVLGVSRSGFYAWLSGEPGRAGRAGADAALVERIRAVHAEVGGVYGSPRITAELRQGHGLVVNRKRVARLMRTNDIVGLHRRRRRRTTVSDPAAAAAPDLLGRDFTAETLDARWVGDITYLRAGDRWLYLASVVDLASRRLVGWSLDDHPRTELVSDALEAAVACRGGDVAGVIFHSMHRRTGSI